MKNQVIIGILLLVGVSSCPAMELTQAKSTQEKPSSIQPLRHLAAREIWNKYTTEELAEHVAKNLKIDAGCKELILNTENENFSFINAFMRDMQIAYTQEQRKDERYSNPLSVYYIHMPSDDATVIAWPKDKERIFKTALAKKRWDIIGILKTCMNTDDFISIFENAVKDSDTNNEAVNTVQAILNTKLIPLNNKFYSWPLLCYAVNNRVYPNHKKITAALLHAGCDPNAQEDLTGNTALMLAAATNCVNCTKALLNQHAALEAQNDAGETALVKAVKNKATDVFRLLLSHNANTNVLCEGKSLFDYAKEERYKEIVRLLRINKIENHK
jgi:hypothetical protein